MRKRVICVILALTLLFSLTASVSAAPRPGTPENPVVTFRYIHGDYIPSIRDRASVAAEERMDSIFAAARNLLDGTGAPLNEAALIRKAASRINMYASALTELSFKAGTVLTLGQGARLHLTSGSAAHQSGTLINSTAGQNVEAEAPLPLRNRHLSLSAEARVRITEDAVVYLQGSYRVTPPYVPMYTDLCEALMTMGLINTYQLERVTPRLEMFVVFLRLLGVGEEALAYPHTHPFTDVLWGDGYVSYAFDRGYTVGTSPTTFSPNDTGTVRQMCLILLRALGYRDGIDVHYHNALADAVRLGLFTQRELHILQSEEFTRDAMMYMIYYSLFATFRGSNETMLTRLVRTGAVGQADADRAVASVTRRRFN